MGQLPVFLIKCPKCNEKISMVKANREYQHKKNNCKDANEYLVVLNCVFLFLIMIVVFVLFFAVKISAGHNSLISNSCTGPASKSPSWPLWL